MFHIAPDDVLLRLGLVIFLRRQIAQCDLKILECDYSFKLDRLAVGVHDDLLADLLTHEFGYDTVTAGDFTSLIPWGAAVFTILFGLLIDRLGLRATLMLGGAALLVLNQLAFAFTHVTPWVLIPPN